MRPLLGVSGCTVEGYRSVDGSHDVDRSAAAAERLLPRRSSIIHRFARRIRAAL